MLVKRTLVLFLEMSSKYLELERNWQWKKQMIFPWKRSLLLPGIHPFDIRIDGLDIIPVQNNRLRGQVYFPKPSYHSVIKKAKVLQWHKKIHSVKNNPLYLSWANTVIIFDLKPPPWE